MTDFTVVLKNLDGEDLMEQSVRPDKTIVSKCLTLGSAAANALIMATDEDKGVSGEEKVKRYALAMKVISNKDASLKAEEIAKIKELIGRAYGPLVVGQAWALLDPNA